MIKLIIISMATHSTGSDRGDKIPRDLAVGDNHHWYAQHLFASVIGFYYYYYCFCFFGDHNNLFMPLYKFLVVHMLRPEKVWHIFNVVWIFSQNIWIWMSVESSFHLGEKQCFFLFTINFWHKIFETWLSISWKTFKPQDFSLALFLPPQARLTYCKLCQP